MLGLIGSWLRSQAVASGLADFAVVVSFWLSGFSPLVSLFLHFSFTELPSGSIHHLFA